MSNPGPAITTSIHPSNLSSQSALRVLAVLKNVSVASLGDIPVQVNNTSAYAPATIVVANSNNAGASADVSTVHLGIYTAPAAGGSAVLSSGALTSQTTSAYVFTATASFPHVQLNAQTLYINIQTAVITATVDVYVYGYDLSVSG